MAIAEVTVNHIERNYFNDCDEIRVDRMQKCYQKLNIKEIIKKAMGEQ